MCPHVLNVSKKIQSRLLGQFLFEGTYFRVNPYIDFIHWEELGIFSLNAS